jgi:hypothetical protein
MRPGKTTEDDAAEPGLLDSWLVKGSSENTAVRKTADVVAAGRSNSEPGATGSANGLREPADVTVNKEAAGDAGNDDAAVRSVLESLSYKASKGPAATAILPMQRPVMSGRLTVSLCRIRPGDHPPGLRLLLSARMPTGNASIGCMITPYILCPPRPEKAGYYCNLH